MDNSEFSTETATTFGRVIASECRSPDSQVMKNWGKEYGLINLTHLSYSDRHIHDQLVDGSLIRLTAEVVMSGATYRRLPPWERAAAKAFAVGMTVDKAVVGGQAAARLWGLQTLTIENAVACYLPGKKVPKSPRQWPEGVVYRYGYLSARDIREFHGIRVTGLISTVLDIARNDGLHAAVVVIDSARRQWESVTPEYLHRELEALQRRRGVPVFREAIELSVPNSDSAQETRARLILHEANLPEITSIRPQVRFNRGKSGRYYVVDFLINDRVIVEIDGRSKYKTDTPDQLETALLAERDREKLFTNHGYTVLRIEPKQLDAVAGAECEFLQLVRAVLHKEATAA
ncbi:hypothetical protein CFAEC_11675 [Corynebacterium faecale]|nr:hypothetical protein CFAEC_11675 [Corynebacterium faecale]